MISGVGAYSSAFGEWVAIRYKTPQMLAKGLKDQRVEIAILDVGSSAFCSKNHIPGAWWGIRSELGYGAERLILTGFDAKASGLIS